MKRKCRIWWPKELAMNEPPITSNSFLFGWFSSCSSASIDVIVAFMHDDISLVDGKSGVQDILRDTNGSMSMYLREKSSFCLLGQYCSYLSNDDKVCKFGMVNDNRIKAPSHGIASETKGQETFRENHGGRCCECSQLDGLVKQWWQASVGVSHWIQLAYFSCGQNERDIYCIPRLHHIHWGRQLISQCDVHVCKS
uniref:Phosphatidylinositol N-acetylglucosaminyltransferase subunit GPI1 n=1 Tax=Rhizophora mucronata TaxID=61149 RepID=A0A2P2JCX7_RHIMU